jgi:hypothetical protein
MDCLKTLDPKTNYTWTKIFDPMFSQSAIYLEESLNSSIQFLEIVDGKSNNTTTIFALSPSLKMLNSSIQFLEIVFGLSNNTTKFLTQKKSFGFFYMIIKRWNTNCVIGKIHRSCHQGEE